MFFKNLLLGFGGLGVAGVAGYGIYYVTNNNERNVAKSQYGLSTVINDGQVVTQPVLDKGPITPSSTP